MPSRLTLTAASVIAAALTLAACGSDDDGGDVQTSPAAPDATTTSAAPAPVATTPTESEPEGDDLLTLADVKDVLSLPDGYKTLPPEETDDPGENLCGKANSTGITLKNAVTAYGGIGEQGPFSYQTIAVFPTEAAADKASAALLAGVPCTFEEDGTTSTVSKEGAGSLYRFQAISFIPAFGWVEVRQVRNALYVSSDLALGAAPGKEGTVERAESVEDALEDL